MSVVAVGLNHRTVPLDLLERMTVPASRLPKALADLTSRENVTEAVVLSTCNRIEVYAFAEKFHGAYQDIRNFFAETSHVAPEEFSDHLVGLFDGDAARHLFSVASGLDSAVLGEHEILGQVRTSWETAAAEGAVGPVLNPLFRHALEVGKRVRTETAISRNITSVSQAAVAMATDRLGTLEGRQVMVVGAGEMGEGLARALHGGGVASILVANRTWERAVDVAKRLGGTAVRLDDLPRLLPEVDVLLTSTGASSVILEHGDLASVVGEREGRELLVVDIAVPRDVDPAAGEIDGLTLLDMDDLRAFADAGIRERQREVTAVQAIVDAELDRYVDESTARSVAPLVTSLRGRGEDVQKGELERLAARLGDLDERQREAVEALAAGIVGKLLHEPTIRMKDAAGTARGERLAEALRDLFDL
ncbi:MAG: glutamyl-tRNA reductase [Acidimicrobiales bacterium]|nr:glutamyl-tRNA reductase [Acidimicrobiales bacterium]MDP6287532.1 glutamyl-tRNA reductase [Acidimicrobiales bacterium]MDP6911676.1 glutamyl-tRNA reductase [Acidimicrobiales bacterium]HJP23929.1 glutamyl-tRNA reductase [Acidimicrobiales bacterium]